MHPLKALGLSALFKNLINEESYFFTSCLETSIFDSSIIFFYFLKKFSFVLLFKGFHLLLIRDVTTLYTHCKSEIGVF